jgi:hypothetical protein
MVLAVSISKVGRLQMFGVLHIQIVTIAIGVLVGGRGATVAALLTNPSKQATIENSPTAKLKRFVLLYCNVVL